MRKFDLVKQWEQDGLHHARIKALVEVEKLAEKLKGQDIATREVPGELLYQQVQFDVRNEEQAVEMFEKVMQNFRMQQLCKVEIEGSPEITDKDEIQATLRVQVAIHPDLGAWHQFLKDLRPLLEIIAPKNDTLAVPGRFQWETLGSHAVAMEVSPDNDKIVKRLGNSSGLLLNVFRKMNRKGDITYWDVYLVPKGIAQSLSEIGARNYSLKVRFLDEAGNELASEVIAELRWNNSHRAAPYFFTQWRIIGHFIGPFFFYETNGEHHYEYPAGRIECITKISLEKLRSVKQVSASLE